MREVLFKHRGKGTPTATAIPSDEDAGEGGDFELPLIQSALIPPGFHHGFTTRRGGVSTPPFDSLNLVSRWGDRPEDVAENQRRLRMAAGDRAIFFAAQVHGSDSLVVGPGSDRGDVGRTRADAVIAAGTGVAVGAYVADCVPVLIADLRSGACAAVHAGWRGTVAGVLRATMRRMFAELGSRPGDLAVAIGPSIGPCCFEVGPEVVAAVEAAFPEGRGGVDAIRDGGVRPHVDLWMLNRLAAEAEGVPADQIEVAGLCTRCDHTRFFSYRRDRGTTGQLAAFIVCDQEPRRTTP